MSSGCRSISPWSPRLRLYGHVCRRINQPLSSRFVVHPLPITTTIEPSSTVKRHYASRRLRRAPAREVVNKQTFEADTEDGRQRAERSRQLLRNDAAAIYKSALREKVFDDKVTPELFEDIARRLIDVSSTDYADAISVKRVYDGDPNLVLAVALALYAWVPWHPRLLGWALTATASAGATISVVKAVERELQQPFTTYQTKPFLQCEVLAKRGIPLAVRMQADVYWDQKRYDEALELLEQLHSRTYPSNTPAGHKDDITLAGGIPAPWSRLAEYYLHLEQNDKVDAMTKVGALDYQDPDALMAYAHFAKERKEWDVYEQCISVAATAGNGTACLRLGNFYYLMYQGKIPSADKLPEDASWLHSVFHKMFGKPRTPQDFRKLAIDWYNLAQIHGNKKAIRNFVVLVRQDGEVEAAAAALSKLEQTSPEDWRSPNMVKLRAKMGDLSFQPKIPPSWLEL